MYTNAIYMDKYLSEGFNKMLSLNKSEYNKLKISTEINKSKLEGIYKFLGFGKLFGTDENLCQSVLEYYVKYNLPLTPIENEVFQEHFTQSLTAVNGCKVIQSNSIIIEGKNITTAIHAKTGMQIKSLVKIINNDLDTFNLFTKYYKGSVPVEEFTEKIRNYLAKNVSIIRADTNIAYKSSGSKVTLYFPESDANLDLMDPLEYVERLIYSEMNDNSVGMVTQSLRARAIQHLNEYGSLRNLNLTNPSLLFELEYIRRKNGCDSIEVLLQDILYLGKLVVHTPNAVCYYGNLDGTVTLHVKTCVCKLEKKYLPKILADKSLVFSIAKEKVYVTSEKHQSKITLWEYLLGKSTKPIGSVNDIVESNFKL